MTHQSHGMGEETYQGHRLKILDKCIDIPHTLKALSFPLSWFHWVMGEKTDNFVVILTSLMKILLTSLISFRLLFAYWFVKSHEALLKSARKYIFCRISYVLLLGSI